MGEIESNIPIPEKRGNSGPRTEAGRRAAAMKIGDSVFCENDVEYHRLRTLLCRGGRKSKSARENGGIRVWRVS